MRRNNGLPSWFVHCELHGTSYSSPVKPAISIHPNGLPGKLLETAWFMNGLEQREQTYDTLKGTQWPDKWSISPWMPMMPRTKRVDVEGVCLQHELLACRVGRAEFERKSVRKLGCLAMSACSRWVVAQVGRMQQAREAHSLPSIAGNNP
jgi:hypothetical protein